MAADGIDHCYDCRAAASIWLKYFDLCGHDSLVSRNQRVRAEMAKMKDSAMKPPHAMLPEMRDISKKIHQLSLYTMYFHNTGMSFVKILAIKRGPVGSFQWDKWPAALKKPYKKYKKNLETDPRMYAWRSDF